MSLLEVRDLKAGYGSLPVLQGISFDVEEGETAVLLGPERRRQDHDGADPRRPAQAVGGNDHVQRRGHHRDGSPQARRRRASCSSPRAGSVFPQLTVAQNLRLGAWPYKKDRKETREIVERAVEYFPRLRERWTQLAGTLSGGEQQMLAIARGLMARPKLLLIDESSLGLSPKLTQTVFEVVKRINEDGTTVFMVEQNAGVLKIVDRAFVMEKGTLIYSGTSADGLDYAQIQEAYLGMTA